MFSLFTETPPPPQRKINYKMIESRYRSLFCGIMLRKRFSIDPLNKILVCRGALNTSLFFTSLKNVLKIDAF